MRIFLHFTSTQRHAEAMVTAFSLEKWRFLSGPGASLGQGHFQFRRKVCLLVQASQGWHVPLFPALTLRRQRQMDL